MKKTILLFELLFLAIAVSAQPNLETHQIYSAEGQELSFEQLADSCKNADVVLFGELHNHAMLHYIQLQLAKSLKNVAGFAMGGEFFERDDQLAIDEYLSGILTAKKLNEEVQAWPNYQTDYAPLLELCRNEGIPFTATNVPRRYAVYVSRYGLDTLAAFQETAGKLLPELPIEYTQETPGYSEMMAMMGAHRGADKAENFVMAQALKDATMAESILNSANSEGPFLHINGDFHSADYGGIYWYIRQSNPEIKVLTIKVFQAENLDFTSDYQNTGDIIIVVPEDFTKTH